MYNCLILTKCSTCMFLIGVLQIESTTSAFRGNKFSSLSLELSTINDYSFPNGCVFKFFMRVP